MTFNSWWTEYAKEKSISLDNNEAKKIAEELFKLQQKLPDFIFTAYEEGFTDHIQFGGEVSDIESSFDESKSKSQILCPFIQWINSQKK